MSAEDRKAALSEINRLRTDAGLRPVKLDDVASSCAADHCEAMVKFDFLSGWDLLGARPAERYAVCDGFVAEAVGGSEENLRFSRLASSDAAALCPAATHVGVGFAAGKGRARYAEVFLCQDTVVDEPDAAWCEGGTIVAMQTSGDSDLKPLGAVLYRDAGPAAGLTPDEATAAHASGDAAALGAPILSVPPWKMQQSESDPSKWAFPLEPPESALQPGLYTLVVYAADWKQRPIPREAPGDGSSGFALPGETGSACAVCVLEHGMGRPTPAPVTGLWVVHAEEGAPALPPPGSDVRTSGPAPDVPDVVVCFEREAGDALLDIRVVGASSVEGAAPEPPEGFELLPVSLCAVEGGTDAYLCQRRGPAAPGDEVVTQVALAYGPSLPGTESLSVPVAAGASVCFRRQTWVPEASGRGAEAGLAARIEETQRLHEASARAERAAEAERERREERERERMVVDQERQRAARDADLSERLARLEAENLELSRKVAVVMLRRGAGAAGGGAPDAGAGAAGPNAPGAGDAGPATNPMEAERRYLGRLGQWTETQRELEEMKTQYNRAAMDLQARLDDKEAKGNEIRESFADFKREIAKSAENSRTGKTIPRKIIRQFELAEQRKDEDVEKVRIANIKHRMAMRKLERRLKEKEQLAEGLHLIDFEQLKIENQTLNEKIEERNEELAKFKKKTETTVQVLTHVKEKLQFVRAQKQVLDKENEQLDDLTALERERLTKLKRERDAARAEQEKLKGDKGFSGSAALVQDFEKRKHDIETLQQELARLKQNFRELTGR
jgi:hypothetical protein